MAEQLALEQRLGHRRAVDGHERSLRSPAPVCIALATSSLPVPLSPVTRTVASVWATRATRSYTFCICALVADHVGEVLGFANGAAKALDLFTEPLVAHCPIEGEREMVHLERLRDEVVRARSDRPDGGFHAPERGHHHDGQVRPTGGNLLAELEPARPLHVRNR